MIVDIPNDLAYAVARSLEDYAKWYRHDTGHAPEDVAKLNRDADRLDAIAAFIDAHEQERP